MRSSYGAVSTRAETGGLWRPPIPFIHLSESLVGKKHCFDAWREELRAVYDVCPLADAPVGDEVIKAWLLDNLVVTDVRFSRQTFRHDRRHTRDSNYLSLQIYRDGVSRGDFAGGSCVMLPGEVHLFDFSREFYSVTENSAVAGVLVPHDVVGYDPAQHPPHMSFPGHSPIGRFLTGVVFSLSAELPNLRQEDARAISKGLSGLLRDMFFSDTQAEEGSVRRRAERSAEMRSYLDRHLLDPKLNADTLCRVFNVSRPSIYRDFAEVGGVAQYILQRRLERAFHQLLSIPASHGRVKEVAHRCGFADQAHFSRLFRQRFGIPPSEVTSDRASRIKGMHRPVLVGGKPMSARLPDWFKSL
jgi:AraC-like DNA-binding protein